MIALKTAHVYAGYVFAINLAWRLAWAFVGGARSRWSALLPWGKGFGRGLVAFVTELRAGRFPAHLGHSPLARIVLSAIVLLLIMQAATGLVLAGTDVYMPPLGGYFLTRHELFAWAVAPAVVAAVGLGLSLALPRLAAPREQPSTDDAA